MGVTSELATVQMVQVGAGSPGEPGGAELQKKIAQVQNELEMVGGSGPLGTGCT